MGELRGKSAISLPPWFDRYVRAILSLANTVATKLDRHQTPFLLFFSFLYFGVTGFRAYRKLFWFDEIFTLYLTRLPGMVSIWDSLISATDLNPPLFYLLTRIAIPVAGDGPLGLRIPEIVGFWIACLCLFVFVSRRSSALSGAISMVFPMVTLGYYYAYEARPHAIVFGMAGLALVCWQSAIRSPSRLGWILGVFAALACAILNHTYGVLLIFPLALAEFARGLQRKRIDWPLSAAIAASLLAVYPSFPLWKASATAYPGFAQASLAFLIKAYQSILEPAGLVVAIAMLLWFAFDSALPDESSTVIVGQKFELPEIMAIIGFSLLPMLAYLLASVTGAPIIARYTLSMLLGFSCAFGIVMGRNPAVGLCTLILLAGQVGFGFLDYAHGDRVVEPSSLAIVSTRENDFKEKYEAMAEAGGARLPIVLAYGVEFLPVIHYAPPELANSMVCLDRPGFMLFKSFKRLIDFGHSKGRVQPEREFLAANQSFLIYVPSAGISALRDFVPSNADVLLMAMPGDGFLYRVTQR